MKKNSFAIRLLLYASLAGVFWVAGYIVLSGLFYVSEQKDDKRDSESGISVELPETAPLQWSVLAVVDAERRVSSFWLRYADFLADTLVFTEVPVNTKVELATGGYEILSVHNPEQPKLFMISDMCRIFSEETWCMAAEEVCAALFGLRPEECYVLDESVYGALTEIADGTVRFVRDRSEKEMICLAAEQAVTNDTLSAELVYLESYRDIKKVLYTELPGEKLPEEFRPNAEAVREMIARFRTGQYDETVEER